MKKRYPVTAAILLLLQTCTIPLFAHEGGHYQNGAPPVFNTWRLGDGRMIRGNFSSGNEHEIVLEQRNGKWVTVALADLTIADRRLAELKIRSPYRRNQAFITTDDSMALNGTERIPWWIGLTVTLTTCVISLFWVLLTLRSRTLPVMRKIRSVVANVLLLAITAIACKKNADSVAPPVTTMIPKTRISFMDSAFAPHRPYISTNADLNYYYIAGTGFPQHNMMVGITSWQQQVPIPQNYSGTNSWSIPLQPEYAPVPMSTKTNFMKGAVAIAVNGIPIFNAYNNRGVDSYLTGELDNWGGHCGRADDYHYHVAPLHLASVSPQRPIAFALDGFAVYASMEPDGSAMKPLDTCHGHSVSNGVYHYHGTNTYPYVVGSMRGRVTLDPNTPAPENQILPQAFASPVRPALTPLNGATITAFQATGTNAFKLTYLQGGRPGYVEYSWDAGNRYTFKQTDTSGAVTINTYQR